MLSFMYFYLGMAALGLAVEAMVTVLTVRYSPYFLFILVSLPEVQRGPDAQTMQIRSYLTLLQRFSHRSSCILSTIMEQVSRCCKFKFSSRDRCLTFLHRNLCVIHHSLATPILNPPLDPLRSVPFSSIPIRN